MSRPIKFRVWNEINKYWDKETSGCIEIIDNEINRTAIWKIGEEKNRIFQQFTGLLDINGKEIYEGDILKSRVNGKPCNYIVKWSDNRSEYCGFALNPVMINPPKITYHIHDFRIWMAEGFEVIGNIFENPELIENK